MYVEWKFPPYIISISIRKWIEIFACVSGYWPHSESKSAFVQKIYTCHHRTKRVAKILSHFIDPMWTRKTDDWKIETKLGGKKCCLLFGWKLLSVNRIKVIKVWREKIGEYPLKDWPRVTRVFAGKRGSIYRRLEYV